ncbi:MAG TPA: hypothetical protein VGA78_11720 [Gemmatimonadales bacterium]
MKLLLLIYSGDSPERITGLLDRHQVEGYTELSGAHGTGRTGRRFGTRAWPGRNTVFFSIVPAEAEAGVVAAVLAESRQLPEGERLHVAVLPVSYAA